MPTCKLEDKRCIPCCGGVPPLTGDELETFRKQLGIEWTVADEHHLEKTYSFKNFREALDFTNAAGEIAEQEGHHPEIILTWGRVTIQIWTHAIDGLTESDFVLAAKTDRVFREKSGLRKAAADGKTE